MSVGKVYSPLELTPLEAACNMALFQEHQREAEKKYKHEINFGVYCSRSFVVITRKTPWMERIKRYLQWLFGLISYEQQEIAKLAERSRKQWVPAAEMEAKVQQLAAAKNLQEEAQNVAQDNASKLQAAEEQLQHLCTILISWKNSHQLAQDSRAHYERLHKEIQNQEDIKDREILQKQKQIRALELANSQLQQENQKLTRYTPSQLYRELMQLRLKLNELSPFLNLKNQESLTPIEMVDRAIKELRRHHPQQKGIAISRRSSFPPTSTPSLAASKGAPPGKNPLMTSTLPFSPRAQPKNPPTAQH